MSDVTLTPAEVEQALVDHNEWSHADGQLIAVYEFPRFLAAIAVINAIAVAAEELQHHPSYTHNYTTVIFRLTTHSAGNTVTQKDIELAQKISTIVALSAKQASN